jgi:hypothetical protein
MYNTEVAFDDLADLRQEVIEIIPLIASVAEGHDKIQRVTDLMTSIENLRDKAVRLFSTDDTNVGQNPFDHIPTVKRRPKSPVRREVTPALLPYAPPQERIDEDGWD